MFKGYDTCLTLAKSVPRDFVRSPARDMCGTLKKHLQDTAGHTI